MTLWSQLKPIALLKEKNLPEYAEELLVTEKGKIIPKICLPIDKQTVINYTYTW